MIRPILVVLVLALLIGFGVKALGHLSGNEKLRLAQGVGFWTLVTLVSIFVMFTLSVLF